MVKLLWSEEAISDLLNIYDYIARDSAQYAKYQVESICKAAEHLQRFPEMGRHLPEFPHLPHRELIIGNYRVVYRYSQSGHEVKIVTVAHGKQAGLKIH